MIKIRYTNAVDVGGISYYDNFTPELYLDVDVGKPNYIYSEEGDEDVTGSFNRTFARLEKQYSIDTYVQEYMLDALMLIQLHDTVVIYLSNGTSVVANEFRIADPEWNELDALAAINITFSVFQESVSSGCQELVGFTCDDMEAPVLTYVGFENGTDLPSQYLSYVMKDGGEVVDYDDVVTFYEELGETSGEPPNLIFTGQATEDTFNLLRIYDNIGTLLYSKSFSAGEINAGEFKIAVAGLAISVVYPLLTTSRYGCDSISSPAGVAANICTAALPDPVISVSLTDDSDAPNFVLVLDPETSVYGNAAQVDFYTQIVIGGTAQGWEYHSTVFSFTEDNLKLAITQEPSGSDAVDAQVKAVGITHICDDAESNTVTFTLYSGG